MGNQPIDLDKYLKFANCIPSGSTSPPLNSLKKKLFESLYSIISGKRSLILALENSVFYHLGTINEMLDLYMNNDNNDYCDNFRFNIDFEPIKNSYFIKSAMEGTDGGCNLTDINKSGLLQNGYLLNTIVSQQTSYSPNFIQVSNNCLLEYCFFDVNLNDYKARRPFRLKINDYCYLNNCYLNVNELDNDTETGAKISEGDTQRVNIDEPILLNIPSGVCMHTIFVNEFGTTKYVTVFFAKNDDLKKQYESFDKIIFLGKQLSRISNISQFLFDNKYSIWNLKVFKSEVTMSKSFMNAVKFINSYLNNVETNSLFDEMLNEKLTNYRKFYSLFDLLSCCDYEKMISYRYNYF